MTFPFTTELRLEVEDPSLLPAGNVLTQIKNPDGALGGWGWITPVGTASSGTATGSAPTQILTYGIASGGAPAVIYSEPAAVTPGTSYIAGWQTRTSAGAPTAYWYRATLSFLDSAGGTLSGGGLTAILAVGTSGTLGSYTVPAGAVQARLAFDFYGSNAGADPPSGAVLGLQDVKMGPTNALSKISLVPLYSNLLNPSTSITIEREGLNVGTLTAVIANATYDPAVNVLLRPGRRVRLIAPNVVGIDGSVFTGKLSTASVVYDPKRTDSRKAIITLSAVDAIADLANVSRPDGVATVLGLRQVVEGAGVPWQINTTTSQAQPVAVVSRNESASVLDQIAITRDSNHAFAWMSRTGVLRVSTPANLVTTVGTFTPSDYGDDVDVRFDVDAIINVVTIKHLRINAATGETVEVPYGPFRHEQSIAEWGPRSAEFTLHGLTDTTAAMKAYADEVFAASAVPAVRVNALTFRVSDVGGLNGSRALIDLYRRVEVNDLPLGTVQTPRITAIRHRITPKSWLVDLTFASDSGVASPQQVPALSSPGFVSPASPRQQMGQQNTAAFTVNVNQPVAIVFPVPFDTVPTVLANVAGNAASQQISAVTVTAVTTSGCTLNVSRSTGTGAVAVAWLALV